MRILMLALPVAVLSLGAIELSSRSAQTKAPVSRVHQLEIEDQTKNPGNISPEDYYRHGDGIPASDPEKMFIRKMWHQSFQRRRSRKRSKASATFFSSCRSWCISTKD
jgi:hypothetical protein